MQNDMKWLFEKPPTFARYGNNLSNVSLTGMKLVAINPTNIVLFSNEPDFVFDNSFIFYLDGWYSTFLLPNGKEDYCPGHVVLNSRIQHAMACRLPIMFVVPTSPASALLLYKLRAKYKELSYQVYVWSTQDKSKNGIACELDKLYAKLSSDECIVIFGVGSGVQELVSILWRKPNELVCIGAALDFFYGGQKTPPKYIRTLRLEWLFRFVLDPKRMWRRVILHPLIMLRIWIGCKI